MASNLLAHNSSFEIQRKSTENVHEKRTPSAKPEKEEERRCAPGLSITSEDNLGLNFFPGATKFSKKTPFSAAFENTPVLVFRAGNFVWKIHVSFS